VSSEEACKAKCLEIGETCPGFIHVKTGTYAGKCYFRAMKLRKIKPYTTDERDCYEKIAKDETSHTRADDDEFAPPSETPDKDAKPVTPEDSQPVANVNCSNVDDLKKLVENMGKVKSKVDSQASYEKAIHTLASCSGIYETQHAAYGGTYQKGYESNIEVSNAGGLMATIKAMTNFPNSKKIQVDGATVLYHLLLLSDDVKKEVASSGGMKLAITAARKFIDDPRAVEKLLAGPGRCGVQECFKDLDSDYVNLEAELWTKHATDKGFVMYNMDRAHGLAAHQPMTRTKQQSLGLFKYAKKAIADYPDSFDINKITGGMLWNFVSYGPEPREDESVYAAYRADLAEAGIIEVMLAMRKRFPTNPWVHVSVWGLLKSLQWNTVAIGTKAKDVGGFAALTSSMTNPALLKDPNYYVAFEQESAFIQSSLANQNTYGAFTAHQVPMVEAGAVEATQGAVAAKPDEGSIAYFTLMALWAMPNGNGESAKMVADRGGIKTALDLCARWTKDQWIQQASMYVFSTFSANKETNEQWAPQMVEATVAGMKEWPAEHGTGCYALGQLATAESGAAKIAELGVKLDEGGGCNFIQPRKLEEVAAGNSAGGSD